MKFSSKVQKCGLSPMRKFHPYAVAAQAKGRRIYHLNIGQPDIETPRTRSLKRFGTSRSRCWNMPPRRACRMMLDAVRGLLRQSSASSFDAERHSGDLTARGEALEIRAGHCILDDGDELLVPEPFYANYNTFAYMTGGVHPAHSHLPGGGLPLRGPGPGLSL